MESRDEVARNMEQLISRVLRVGVGTSLLLIAVGSLLSFFERA